MARLSKPELLGKVLQAVRDGGWLPLVIDGEHPFLIRAAAEGKPSVDFRVFIWNCSHGGKSRSADEFRIQVTGVNLRKYAGEPTLLLGWHDEMDVFAAWDISAHDGQNSASPSAQIKEATLETAHENSFATQVKLNEVVIAFRPVFMMDYAIASETLHQTGRGHQDIGMLNDLDDLGEDEIDTVSNAKRRMVIRKIARKYRAANFSKRVLNAYGHQCAFCRVQLGLLDAAHILPVAAPGSTDEITNGVALCKLHHFAYDSNLVAFDSGYRIHVSVARVKQLSASNAVGGLESFKRGIAPSLALPSDAAA